jgi:sugar (pentulose or hexulose) kinase
MADVFGLDVYVEQQSDAASFGAGMLLNISVYIQSIFSVKVSR